MQSGCQEWLRYRHVQESQPTAQSRVGDAPTADE